MRISISQTVAASVLLAGLSTVPAFALNGKSVVLSPERVAETLRVSGFSARSTEVEFVSSVPVSAATAKLRVEHWRRLSDSTAWVQLRCQQSGDCIPFFVILHSSENNFPAKLPKNNSSLVKPLVAPQSAPLVKTGMRATLFLQSATSRITTVVVCLENGVLGSQVRVKNPVTKQVLMAEVIDKGVVKSTF
jgi:Chaperone for flagella basal body P-ring formation